MKRPAVLLTMVLLAFVAAHGQTSFTRLSGTVRDEAGGVVRGAELTLTRSDTGGKLRTVSNDEGAYVFGVIPPGTYELTAASKGFQAAVYGDLRLTIQTQHRQDVLLKVGPVAGVVTVTASAGADLQKTDAAVGNTIDSARVALLPNPSRRALTLLGLQPGTAPDGDGLSVTGTRRDQQTFQLDGIDISDNVIGNSDGTSVPSSLTPAESVEEFRAAVANPDASFGRSAGANVTLVTKQGTNVFHGSLYWYHQNDELNANSWNNNRRGAPKAELKDNRFGFSLGGPLPGRRTHFFTNYEGRRLPGSTNITRVVPTASLRNGVLRFRDAEGNVRDINPLDFDPRRLGANPAVLAVWRRLPLPNAAGGDGLNTGGFNSDVKTGERDDFGVLRVDHRLGERWNFVARLTADRLLRNSAEQVDLLALKGTTDFPQRVGNALLGLDAALTPRLSNDLRFGWVKHRLALQHVRPTAALPWLPAGVNMAVNIALQAVDEPTDVDTARGNNQTSDADYFQLVDNQSWIRGEHVFQYGADLRSVRFVHARDDKAIGSLSTPVAEVGNLQFTSVPPAQRPAFIRPNDASNYDRLYASLLGIVSNVPYLGVRDENLRPLPVGSSLEADTRQKYLSFYFLDTWRARPSVTFDYGLYYGFTTAPVERRGRQMIAAYAATGEFITARDYLRRKREAALAGDIFNPDVAFVPVNNSGRRSAYDTDYRNLSPRAAVAWNPSFKGGLFGRLFGDAKTVFRGGYSLLWDRSNLVQTVVIPTVGIGFAQTTSLRSPTNAAGEPFRLGVDGPIPVAPFGAASSPVVPPPVFSEILSFSVDPSIKVPHNHVVSFTVQRALPWGLFAEAGYVGRFGRDLYQSLNLQQVPFGAVDRASGQSFAEAFDALAAQLRSGVGPAAVTPQPFFESALAGTPLRNTAGLAAAQTSNIIDGNLNNLFQAIDISRFGAGLRPFNNLQSLDLFMRTSAGRSNYNALVFTLRRRFKDGLAVDFNYTLSKSLDQNGFWQNAATQVPNSFDLDAGYGPSNFDVRHAMNVNWLWELPLGRGRRFGASGWRDGLAGGWFLAGAAYSRGGTPLTFSQGGQGLGGGAIFADAVGGLPLEGVDPGGFGNDVNRGVAGSGGVGTNGGPAAGGTGLNLFADPERVYRSFRRVSLVRDARTGRNLLRAPGRASLDLSVGKRTTVVPRDNPITLSFSADFINALNVVQFADPSLSFSNPAAFGVFTTQANRPRTVQLGLRVEF